MKTLEESIATAMDAEDTGIVPFLPYILQDFWEMGTPPGVVVDLIKKQCKEYSTLHILDLGCGKGAVSVQLAAALKCNCYGIDCIPEFIEVAAEKAKEYGVNTLCRFEVADIRKKVNDLDTFNVIILGSIGAVFGDYYETLTTLSKHLATEGIIIIDDACVDDVNTLREPENSVYGWVISRQELLKQTGRAGMILIDELTGKYSEYSDSAKEMENILTRCNELKAKYPAQSSLFETYIQNQRVGYDLLKNDLDSFVMVVKRRE